MILNCVEIENNAVIGTIFPERVEFIVALDKATRSVDQSMKS